MKAARCLCRLVQQRPSSFPLALAKVDEALRAGELPAVPEDQVETRGGRRSRNGVGSFGDLSSLNCGPSAIGLRLIEHQPQVRRQEPHNRFCRNNAAGICQFCGLPRANRGLGFDSQGNFRPIAP